MVGWDDGTKVLACLATLVEGKSCPDLSCNIVDKIANHFNVVVGHDHIFGSASGALWLMKSNSHIGCAWEELRITPIHGRGTSSPLFLSGNLGICNISTS